MENTREDVIPPYSKPCVNCRKRKVKCDKTRPCSNCSRAKQLCTYELEGSTAGGGQDTLPSTDSDLRERLARLEEMMASMMMREGGTVAHTHPDQETRSSSRQSPAATPESTSQLFHLKQKATTTTFPVGQIVFQEGYSAYFDADFWPGLVNEVEDIRQILQPPAHESTSAASLVPGLLPQLPMANINALHPSIDESNLLLRLFFQSVNPFIHVIHEANFRKELDQYRREVFFLPREFEALLFSIYALTINSLNAEVVETHFLVRKHILLARFQQAAQVSLSNVSFFKTDKVLTIQALLHYLTLLFQQNVYQDAVSLLGVAARLAQTMGYHHDTSNFPYSPWVGELRRRIWNYISCLDALALSSYGAESSLPASDSLPPINANDGDWHASRFAKPSSLPPETFAFKDLTFVLVHRQLAELIRQISKLDATDLNGKKNLIAKLEAGLKETYLKNVDQSNPSQTVIVAFVEVKLSCLRLSIRYQQAKISKAGEDSCFVSAVELLEAFEYYSTTFAASNWEWVFSTLIPWLAIAILLTKTGSATRQEDIDRADRQIERVFNLYSGCDTPVSTTPMWQLLVQLRERLQSDRGKLPGVSPRANYAPQNISTSMPPFSNNELMLEFDMTSMQPDAMLYENQYTLQGSHDFSLYDSSKDY